MTLQETIILNLLKRPLSMADIHQLTEASLPTVRRAVQILADSHWIQFVGQAEANGGRPAMLYGIDETHYKILGIQLQLPGIQIIVTNLNGEVLEKIRLFQKEIPEPNLAVRTIADSIINLTSQYDKRHVLGIGIASPGFIDQSTGEIIAIGRVPSWKNFPICRHLSELTGYRVQIANDVDCMAITEFRDEDLLVNKNFVYIGFCEGVKASLFLNGTLYKGSLGNVGLISTELLDVQRQNKNDDDSQLLTENGLNIAFETLVGELNPSEKKQYEEIVNIASERKKFIAIMNKALDHDNISYPLIQRINQILSIAIANIIFIVQPDEIVFGGMLSELPKEFFLALESSIRQRIPPLVSNNLIIKKGTTEPTNNAAIGAIQHFLHSKLNELLNNI